MLYVQYFYIFNVQPLEEEETEEEKQFRAIFQQIAGDVRAKMHVLKFIFTSHYNCD